MQLDLEAGFRGVDREYAGRALPVEGTLPDWLTGTLYRNGPGRFEVGGERVAHWFDGLAMLTRYAFDGEGVTYTNRFLRSDTYRRATESGRIDSQFATGEGGWLGRVWDLVAGDTTDNCNVHVARFGGEWVALTEVPRYRSFDPETLATTGEFAFEDDLSGTVNCAHVVPDPHRGETVGLLGDYGRSSAYRLYRVPDGSRRRREIAALPAEKPAYLHSFGLAADHLVLTEHPFAVDPRSFLLPGGGDAFVDFFDWEPARGTTFHVVDRDTGDVVAAPTTDAFFVFHHVNAFEEDDAVVVDLVAYPDADVVGGLYLDDVTDWFETGVDGELRRYRVPLDGGAVTSRSLYEGVELPRVAAGDRTRRHRHVFGQGAADPDGNHVVKVNCETGETTRWSERGLFVEEPVFVRAPGADPPSDEGVVLVTALDAAAGRTVLLVLDGETLTERARAPLPHAVPFGFHGRYAP